MKADAVILNPRANAGNGARRWKKLLETELAREHGLADASLFDGSQGLENLGPWVSERMRSGARNIVAAGGDGTVNLVLNAILCAPDRPKDVRLGAVGLGSSNDFHKPYEVTGRHRSSGPHCRLDFSAARAHDVGQFRTREGFSRHFVINASVGVTAEANWNFNEARGALGLLKRRWVDGAIIATALKTFGSYANFKAELKMDGGDPQSVTLTNLGVVKNVHFSGQMRYDVAQPLDDGFFGVHLCEGMGALEMMGVLAALSSGRFSGRPKTSSRQARTLDIEAAQPFAIETDGEVVRARNARFEILSKELLVCP